jgi:hypothetical protein
MAFQLLAERCSRADTPDFISVCCAGEWTACPQRNTARGGDSVHVAAPLGGREEVSYPPSPNGQPVVANRYTFR